MGRFHKLNLNSRARVGRDCVRSHRTGHHTLISTHAPAWGATVTRLTGAVAREFQLTRPRGARHRYRRRYEVYSEFQLTRPRGARPRASSAYLHLKSHFNSRARVGRDRVRTRHSAALRYFNSRARVGRDVSDRKFKTSETLFQLTRPRGARHSRLNTQTTTHLISTHAPAWGATDFLSTSCNALPFQLTRPRGARLKSSLVFIVAVVFQLTRPRGARPSV